MPFILRIILVAASLSLFYVKEECMPFILMIILVAASLTGLAIHEINKPEVKLPAVHCEPPKPLTESCE